MKFRETPLKSEVSTNLISRFEKNRIEPDESFRELYSDYQTDMNRTVALEAKFASGNQEVMLGKAAEALVFSQLTKHEIGKHLQFRPTSHYDDFIHGCDLLVEPRNSTSAPALAAIDITINQQDIKGLERLDTEAAEGRPVGLEEKLLRARAYTDRLSEMDSTHARDLSGWIESGGLHEPRTENNKHYFDEIESLFLMKYYKSPETAREPNKPGYVIGGPQAVISIDSVFINKALQGNGEVAKIVGDLALLEFIYCVQAEQAYLDEKVKNNKSRNIFFDTHYSKVKAWSLIFKRPDMEELMKTILQRNSQSKEFREQVSYYATTFAKVESLRAIK